MKWAGKNARPLFAIMYGLLRWWGDVQVHRNINAKECT